MSSLARKPEAVLVSSPQETNDAKVQFGFWVYIMTDCILFASLFAVYAVLHKNTNGGSPGQILFNLHYVLIETLLLLTSSFTCGLASISLAEAHLQKAIRWFMVTGLLGLSFVAMELHEFSDLVRSGNSWHKSGFLSSYFTLVGTHGLHISIGLLWIIVLLVRVRKTGLTPTAQRRFQLFAMFWHFLDLVWIFIFTIVYLFGALGI